ncbi:MAG: OmpA family protein [Desulfobulbaceae bacterium]
MNKTCLFPTWYRLGLAFLFFSFFLSGCAEIRYDGSNKYTVRQDEKAKIYTVGQHDQATAIYTLRQGGSHEPLQTSRSGDDKAGPEKQAADLPIVIVASDILFEFDKWVIKDDFSHELNQWVDYFQSNPQVTAEIYGHTDSTGPSAYNQKLSEKRAQAVLNYLVEKGVATERLTARGFGESKPIAPNNTSEGRQKNRRVELNL